MSNKSKKKKKKVQEQETRVKLVYLLVLNVIFHPKKRNFKTFFFFTNCQNDCNCTSVISAFSRESRRKLTNCIT